MRFLKATPVLALAASCLLLMSTRGMAEDKTTAAVGSVSGKVVDASGAPVEGASVRVMAAGMHGKKKDLADDGAKDKGGKRGPAVATGTTGADGAFKIENVPAGEYVVAAMVKGKGNGKATVTVKAGEDVTADIKLMMREKKTK